MYREGAGRCRLAPPPSQFSDSRQVQFSASQYYVNLALPPYHHKSFGLSSLARVAQVYIMAIIGRGGTREHRAIVFAVIGK